MAVTKIQQITEKADDILQLVKDAKDIRFILQHWNPLIKRINAQRDDIEILKDGLTAVKQQPPAPETSDTSEETEEMRHNHHKIPWWLRLIPPSDPGPISFHLLHRNHRKDSSMLLQYIAVLTPNPTAAKRTLTITVTNPAGIQTPAQTINLDPLAVHSDALTCDDGSTVLGTVTDYSSAGVASKNSSTCSKALTAPADLIPPADPGPVDFTVTGLVPDQAPVVIDNSATAVTTPTATPEAHVEAVAVTQVVDTPPATNSITP